MPSDSEQAENISTSAAATRTPDRLCPSNYHSYRRHSSPSALGESAGFEFPESSGDDPLHSPEPIRHGGPRNYSSPFLSRGNIRSRAQSSSSDLMSAENDKGRSMLASYQEDDIFSDVKFELQAPPKPRGKRSRACSSGAAVLTKDPILDSLGSGLQASPPTIRTPYNTPSSQTQSIPHSEHNSVEKTRRRITHAVENGDVGLQSDDLFRTPKTLDNRRRSSPSVQRERSAGPAVGCLGITGDQSPELTQNKHSTRRPSSPCRLYKIVKDAEERVLNLKSQRRPSSPKLSSHPQPPKSPVSPISSPRSPLSPSANSVSAGVVVTSSRPSRRRSSISSAASAFAAATAGASPSYAATSPTATKFRFGEYITCKKFGRLI